MGLDSQIYEKIAQNQIISAEDWSLILEGFTSDEADISTQSALILMTLEGLAGAEPTIARKINKNQAHGIEILSKKNIDPFNLRQKIDSSINTSEQNSKNGNSVHSHVCAKLLHTLHLQKIYFSPEENSLNMNANMLIDYSSHGHYENSLKIISSAKQLPKKIISYNEYDCIIKSFANMHPDVASLLLSFLDKEEKIEAISAQHHACLWHAQHNSDPESESMISKILENSDVTMKEIDEAHRKYHDISFHKNHYPIFGTIGKGGYSL